MAFYPALRRLLLAALLLPHWAAAASLSIATEDYPPYHMGHLGRVDGFVTDKVRLMLTRAGIDAAIDILPWRRAYQEAELSPNHCVYSTTRTAEREAQFKWVGPLASSDWALFALARRKLRIARLDDARPYVIGSYNGDVRDGFLAARGYRTEAALDDGLNPEKLLHGRIDLWISDRISALHTIRSHGWDKDIVPVFTLNRVDLYLACNRDTPDAVIDKLVRALASMRRDGSAAAIERRYDLDWR